jgi:predicted enzyme related to lactoylglutathione lyase
MHTRQFQDTMVSARNFDRMVSFYTRFMGLELMEQTADFALLRDGRTGQSLCVTNGPSVETPSPGVAVADLERAIDELEAMGGKVRKRWMLGMLEGANCEDPEGNGLMLWQRRAGLSAEAELGEDVAHLSLA